MYHLTCRLINSLWPVSHILLYACNQDILFMNKVENLMAMKNWLDFKNQPLTNLLLKLAGR